MNIDKGDTIIQETARVTVILIILLSLFISGCVEVPRENQTLYVDDDYNAENAGWGISHFASLQLAIEAVQEGGVVQIAQGIYEGPIVLEKSLALIGDHKQNTVITSSEGLSYGKSLVQILEPDCVISNLNISIVSEVTGRIGIDIESENTIIENLMIQGFEYGIRILYENGSNTVVATTIQNCNTGIYTSYTQENTIRNCEIQNNSLYGIFLNAGSDYNLIDGNYIGGSEYGLRIKGSALNLIVNNTISNNNHGMYFCCGSRNNTVCQNRFVNNTVWHAKDQYNNIWNKDGVGNYWDNYHGNDTDDDGIGEDAYIISEGYSSDAFPIVDLSFFENLLQKRL